MKFGEYLLSKKMIDPGDLEDALKIQRYLKKPIGQILRDCEYISQEDLNTALQKFIDSPSVHQVADCYGMLQRRIFSKELLKFGESHDVLPFEEEREGITFVTKLFRDEVLEEAEEKWKVRASFIVSNDRGFDYLKTAVYGSNSESPSFRLSESLTDDDRITMGSPYTSLFRDSIQSARKMEASDVHFQPTENGVDIRFRVYGDLFTWKSLPVQHRQSFMTEAKRLSNLSIGVHGRAQDSRISFKKWNLDVRVSLMPCDYGEKIVLRLFDKTRKFDLGGSGLDRQAVEDLRSALNAKNGVLIVSGPTGSGKTTTLYALLTSLDRVGKNIITLEDPIEHSIDGLTQVQVNPKLSFSDALRAVLRQDPDVILVGEVRDKETADLCMKAAQTGHLVLSTLHANGAAEVMTRFLALGVDKYVLKSTLRFSAAQRLVKRLCPSCSIPMREGELRDKERELSRRGISLNVSGDIRKRNPEGCSQCAFGVVGRAPVLEYMRGHEIEDHLKHESDPKLAISLVNAALKLCEKGKIDPNEILEVA